MTFEIVAIKADIMGFGHPMKAIIDAELLPGTFCFHNGEDDLVLFKIQDQITGTAASVKTHMIGIRISWKGTCEILKDDDLVYFLNEQTKQINEISSTRSDVDLLDIISHSSTFLDKKITHLGLPFKMPIIQPISGFLVHSIKVKNFSKKDAGIFPHHHAIQKSKIFLKIRSINDDKIIRYSNIK